MAKGKESAKTPAAAPAKAAPAAAPSAPKVPAPPKTARTLAVEKTAHGFRRKMVGKVIKAKMAKTVVVECVASTRDRLYGKYVKHRTRYKAHDETNQYKVGDQVEIQEHSPISRDKRFIVVRLVKKFVEE
jgi:small subunit ribosomal protein S17